jgi:hypothetical protein
MTTIYGLRTVGTDEIRYIGRTEKPLELRLTKHYQNAVRRSYPPIVSDWIKKSGPVEIVALRQCESAIAASTERQVVELYHGHGHRLTNAHLLPRPTPDQTAARATA